MREPIKFSLIIAFTHIFISILFVSYDKKFYKSAL